MSIQQHNSNQNQLNADRLLNRTYNTLGSIIKRIKDNVADKHASIVLNDSFWSELQTELTEFIDKHRQMLASGQYTDAAKELRALTMHGIRTAVETFREHAIDNPFCIHSDAAWNEFYLDILSYRNPK